MAGVPASVAQQAELLKADGNTYFKKERLGAAIDAYTEAIALCPNVAVYWTNRALCYRKRNEWSRVEEDCRKALEIDSNSVKIASIVSSSIHPLSNLRSLKSMGQDGKNCIGSVSYCQRVYRLAFVTALEKLLKSSTGRYATGDEAQLADVFLAPQILKAMKRFQVDMSPFPTLARLNEAYMEHPAFQSALPERQPDAFIAS